MKLKKAIPAGVAIALAFTGLKYWLDKPYCSLELLEPHTVKEQRNILVYAITKITPQRRELQGNDPYRLYLRIDDPDGLKSVSMTVNGKPMKLAVEPRVTLLDALREKLQMTGAKRVCDRGTCGACTVIMGGKAIYACTVLAIDAQGKNIQTVEGLAPEGQLHPISKAFVDHDAQQCGYCTPGFVMAAKGLLDRNPSPTAEQVHEGLAGNLCRCGTYMGVRKAVLEASRTMKARGGKNG